MFTFLTAASPLLAHTGDHPNGLLAGLAHPWLGVDHLLAMLMVGLLAAHFTVRRNQLFVPAAFIAAMIAGAAAGFFAPMHPAVEWIISASVIVLGLLLAAIPRVQLFWVLPVVAAAALFHGYAHAAEATGHAAAYILGFVAATAALHALGLLAGLLLLRTKQPLLLRLSGATVAAAFATNLLLVSA